MVITLLFFLFVIFYYYFKSAKQLSDKVNAIHAATRAGEKVYIDPVTRKRYWIETGEQVRKTVYNSNFYGQSKDAVTGEHVLMGLKTKRIYENYTYERFVQHVQKQIEAGEVWCYERHSFADSSTERTRFHLKDRYFYKLSPTPFLPDLKRYYVRKLINERPYEEKIEISAEEYKKLGGHIV